MLNLPYVYGVSFNALTKKWLAFNDSTGHVLSLHNRERDALAAVKRYERIRVARIVRNPLSDLHHTAV